MDRQAGRDSKGLQLLHYVWRMQPGGEGAGWMGYGEMDGNGGKNRVVHPVDFGEAVLL